MNTEVKIAIEVLHPSAGRTTDHRYESGDLDDPAFITRLRENFNTLLDGVLQTRRPTREHTRNEPVALDDRSADQDPGNTDPDEMTAPLDPSDDVYSLIRPENSDIHTTHPAADRTSTETYGH